MLAVVCQGNCPDVMSDMADAEKLPWGVITPSHSRIHDLEAEFDKIAEFGFSGLAL